MIGALVVVLLIAALGMVSTPAAGGDVPGTAANDAERFAQQVYAAVLESASIGNLSPAAVDLIVAHAALESGWGKARAAVRGFNVFNITAGSQWQGESWVDVGGDRNAAGELITQTWRVYGSLEEAIADYWSFLGPAQNGGRYVSARLALSEGNLSAFCQRLSRAGYFELNVSAYTQRLQAVAARVADMHARGVL